MCTSSSNYSPNSWRIDSPNLTSSISTKTCLFITMCSVYSNLAWICGSPWLISPPGGWHHYSSQSPKKKQKTKNKTPCSPSPFSCNFLDSSPSHLLLGLLEETPIWSVSHTAFFKGTLHNTAIGLAKRFIQVFPWNVTKIPEWTFWPT